MLVLRVGTVLVVIAVALGVGLYLLTGDRRYLRFALRVFQIALIVAAVVFGLLVLERIIALA